MNSAIIYLGDTDHSLKNLMIFGKHTPLVINYGDKTLASSSSYLHGGYNMTEQMTETSNNPMPEPDTYHDQKVLIRWAEIADRISWFFLFLFVVVAGIIGYLAYYSYTNQIKVEQFLFALPPFLVPLILGLFIWIGLKLFSEVVYLLMDIEDNTRRPQPPAKE
jgi:hypothetical protein